MKRNDKYIMFYKTTKADDGSRYIGNVKYMVKEETQEHYLVSGKSQTRLNKFPKRQEDKLFTVKYVVQDG